MSIEVVILPDSTPGRETRPRSQLSCARNCKWRALNRVARRSRLIAPPAIRAFWIHSRWTDDAAFEVHAELTNTLRFLDRIEQLIDHPLDVSRTYTIT
jgi:hypothetical protein